MTTRCMRQGTPTREHARLAEVEYQLSRLEDERMLLLRAIDAAAS